MSKKNFKDFCILKLDIYQQHLKKKLASKCNHIVNDYHAKLYSKKLQARKYLKFLNFDVLRGKIRTILSFKFTIFKLETQNQNVRACNFFAI